MLEPNHRKSRLDADDSSVLVFLGIREAKNGSVVKNVNRNRVGESVSTNQCVLIVCRTSCMCKPNFSFCICNDVSSVMCMYTCRECVSLFVSARHINVETYRWICV